MYLLLTDESNKTHGKEGSVLVAQLIGGVVDGQGGDHLPDAGEGSKQSNGDRSEGGRVDAVRCPSRLNVPPSPCRKCRSASSTPII